MAELVFGIENQPPLPNYVDKNFHVHLAASLNQFKIHRNLCDVTLKCGKEEIMAHKIILAAASEYFYAMFTGGLSESNLNEIELKDLEAESVKSLINYAYTGTLDINSVNVQHLLEASDLLQFKIAKDFCGDFIANQIDTSNCLDIYQLADCYSCDQLSTKALHFFKCHFSEILKMQQFLNLTLPCLKTLLQSDEICVKDETYVLQACLEWMQYDPLRRQCHQTELLQCVRFSFIGPKDLQDIFNEYAIKELEVQTKRKHPLLKTSNFIRFNTNTISVRRSYQKWLYVLGGERSFLTEIKDVECLSHGAACWELCKPLKSPRSSFAAVAIGKKLYIVGGMRRGVKLRSAKCFDSETCKWTTLSPPLKCRGDIKAAAVDDMLYVAGGSGDRESACRYFERYNPVTKTWSKLPKMNFRRRRFNLVALNEHLYALGGFDDKQGDLDCVEHYDLGKNCWTEDASMITPRNDFGAVALSGYIYAVGGVNGARGSMDLVEKYDPVTNAWTQCSSMQNCRGALSVAVYFGRIVALSGINIYMSLTEGAEYYDEIEDKWHKFPALQIARSGSVAVCLPFRMPNCEQKANELF